MKVILFITTAILLPLLGFHVQNAQAEMHVHELQRYSLSFGDYPGVHFYPNIKRKNNPTLVFTLASLQEVTPDQRTVVREFHMFTNFKQKAHEYGNIFYETEGQLEMSDSCTPTVNFQMRNWNKPIPDNIFVDMHSSLLEYRLIVKGWCPESSNNILKMTGVVYSSNGAKVRVGGDILVSKLDPKHYVQFNFDSKTIDAPDGEETGNEGKGLTFPFVTTTRVEFASLAPIQEKIVWSGLVALAETQPRNAKARRALSGSTGGNSNSPSSDRGKDSGKNSKNDKQLESADDDSKKDEDALGDSKEDKKENTKDKGGKKTTKPARPPLFDEDDEDDKEDSEENVKPVKNVKDRDDDDSSANKKPNKETNKDTSSTNDSENSEKNREEDSESRQVDDAAPSSAHLNIAGMLPAIFFMVIGILVKVF